jgi:hypothetical protein
MVLGEASPQNGSTHPDADLPEKQVLMIAPEGYKALDFQAPSYHHGDFTDVKLSDYF